MNEWSVFSSLWEYLTQDVAIIGGLQSPMLSWIGVVGILALCCWNGAALLYGLWQIRKVLSRLQSKVSSLLVARQRQSKGWIVIAALPHKRPSSEEPSQSRRDLDDLQALDRIIHSEEALIAEWLSYRKTFAIEQSAWFLEPAVYSQKPAAEFFSFDVFLSRYLNIGFYKQLPSFLTGIGLMFTFLAILIGLSKLHATGSHIEGIQGLINGLSGKFVTSIVGLACANAFTLLEASLWHRVADQHRKCISSLDEIFPQRAIDRHAQLHSVRDGISTAIVKSAQSDSSNQLSEVVYQRLNAAVTAFTDASRSFTAMSTVRAGQKDTDLPGEIGHEVQRAMKSVIHPLMEAIQDLNRTVKGQSLSVQLSKSEIEAIFQDLKTHRTATQKNGAHSTK